MPEKHPLPHHLNPADLSAEDHEYYEQRLNEIGDDAEVSAKLANPQMLTPPYIHYIFEAAKDPEMRALYKEMTAELALLPPTPEYIHVPEQLDEPSIGTGAIQHID